MGGGGGGSLEPRTAIKLSFSAGGGVSKNQISVATRLFPDSGSDRDSDETFQILRNLGLELDEFVCLLDSQPWTQHIKSPLYSYRVFIVVNTLVFSVYK